MIYTNNNQIFGGQIFSFSGILHIFKKAVISNLLKLFAEFLNKITENSKFLQFTTYKIQAYYTFSISEIPKTPNSSKSTSSTPRFSPWFQLSQSETTTSVFIQFSTQYNPDVIFRLFPPQRHVRIVVQPELGYSDQWYHVEDITQIACKVIKSRKTLDYNNNNDN